MATYQQWRAGFKGVKSVRRLTWVCGAEPVLVHEVTGQLVAALEPRDHLAVLYAGSTAEAEVWAACAQHPLPAERRMVVVREAHRLARWEDFEPGGQAYIVFVSGEDRYDERDGTGRRLLPGPAVVRAASSGQIIRCQLSYEGKVAWAQERLGPSPLAGYLVDRAGQDLAEVAEVCQKLELTGPCSVCGQAACVHKVDVLCGLQPAESFVDCVLLGMRAAAVLASPLADEMGAVIGLLSARLDTLALLNSAAAQGLPGPEVERKLGVHRLLRAKYGAVGKDYPPARVAACRRLLAEADTAYRSGVREGLAEVLAASW